jgi:hypothetical protein
VCLGYFPTAEEAALAYARAGAGDGAELPPGWIKEWRTANVRSYAVYVGPQAPSRPQASWQRYRSAVIAATSKAGASGQGGWRVRAARTGGRHADGHGGAAGRAVLACSNVEAVLPCILGPNGSLCMLCRP